MGCRGYGFFDVAVFKDVIIGELLFLGVVNGFGLGPSRRARHCLVCVCGGSVQFNVRECEYVCAVAVGGD